MSLILNLAFEEGSVAAASRIAEGLENFPYRSERILLSGIAHLTRGETALAIAAFSKALTFPAYVSDFGMRLRRHMSADLQQWLDLDNRAPGLRKVVVQHYPSLDGKRALLFSHNLEIQGAPLCLLQLVQHLVEANSQVSVVSPHNGPLKQTLEELGVSVIISPQYAARHKFEAFDFIVLNTLETWWAMDVIPSRFHHKVVWWVHESAREQYWRQYPSLPFIFPKARKHIFVTSLSRSNFADLSLRDFEIVHNGVAVHAVETAIRTNSRENLRRTLGLSDDDFLISLVGSVNRHKNQLDFIRAAAQLLKLYQGPLKPRFLIAGFTGEIADYEQEVLSLVKSLRLSDHVHLLNKSPDVLKLFSASDAYACPSVVESFGRTIIEAMAFGVPVVAYASDGIPEVLRGGDCGRLVPSGDWKLMASILLEFLTNPEEAARVGLRGRHCVLEHYTEEKMLRKIASILTLIAHSSEANVSSLCVPPVPLLNATCVDRRWLLLGGLEIQHDVTVNNSISVKGPLTQVPTLESSDTDPFSAPRNDSAPSSFDGPIADDRRNW